MAIQSAFYFTDGTTRTFPSTKHIASSSNVAVWMKRVVDDVWELTSYELWTLANNSIVFTVAPQSTVYSQIELRIADESDELTESPSNIALVAGSIANVDTVATNISAVNTVSTNITAVQNTSANATNINTVSTNIANVNNVAIQVIPNLSEILLADDNAATATAQAGIATAQAGISTTKASEAATYASNALTSENNAIAAAQAAGVSADEVGTWTIASPFSVATIGDLSTIDTNKYTTAIVKDLDRGGTFVWSATGTANGGTVFAGTTGYWTRQYDGAVNVKWFGAKGDGVTDDTTAINSSITGNPDGVTIYFPMGTYLVSNSNPSAVSWDDRAAIWVRQNNVALIGDGVSVTKIFLANSSNANVIKFGQRMDASVIVSDCSISDMEIDGNRANQSNPTQLNDHWSGIDVSSGATRINIRNMYIHNTQYYGIGFQTNDFVDCSITNCIVTDTGADGIDWKDNTGTNSGNSIHNVIVRRFGLFDRLILPEQAGINVRGGVSINQVEVHEFTGDRKGIRLEHGLTVNNKSYGPLTNFKVYGGPNSDITSTSTLFRTGLDIGRDLQEHPTGIEISGGDVWDLVSGNATTKDVGVNIRSYGHRISTVKVRGCDTGIQTRKNSQLVAVSIDNCEKGILLLDAYNQVSNAAIRNCSVSGVEFRGGLNTLTDIVATDNLGTAILVTTGALNNRISTGIVRSNGANIVDNGTNTSIAGIDNVKTDGYGSAIFGIASVTIRTINVPHGLSFTPDINLCTATIQPNSGETDYRIGFVQINSVDATNVNVSVAITTASSTGTASAKVVVHAIAKKANGW